MLTANAVQEVFKDCLFKDGEDTSKAVLVEGVAHKFGFHPERLANNQAKIASLLAELPDTFKASGGGGWSFLNGCMTKTGEQWGEQMNVEQLMVLGLATNKVKLCLPRGLWDALPGGVPYFAIVD